MAAAIGAALCLGGAADPADRLTNPASEARARSIFRETRCLVCQGESIDDSDAPLAADLRSVVRQKVAAGATDARVRAFLVARYGEFVLLRPRLSVSNALLWGAPFAVFGIGAGVLIRRRRRQPPTPPLSPEEEALIATLGKNGGV